MGRVAVDPNIIIDYLRDKTADFEMLKEESVKEEVQLIIPTVVATELFAGSETRIESKRAKIEKIISSLRLIDLDLNIARLVGFLIRDYTRLKDPIDAVIAATATHLNAPLATRNKKDFEFVEGLKFYEGI